MKEEESLVKVPEAPKIENPKVDYYGKPFKYIANSKIKSEGTVIAYTEEMIKEIMRCRKDIFYFAENYYKIVHPDFGFMNIDLRDYQNKCLQEFIDNRFSICKWPRF